MLNAARALAAADTVKAWDRARPEAPPGTRGREVGCFLWGLPMGQKGLALACRAELAARNRLIEVTRNARTFDEKLAEKVSRHESHLSRQLLGALRELGWTPPAPGESPVSSP